jgi:hypothetical protein
VVEAQEMEDPMKDSIPVPGTRLSHELDPVLVDRELQTLDTVLLGPITTERLTSWTATSVIRADILANTIWGTIRWRKTLGRPTLPVLASAFVIEHRSWQQELNIVNGVGRYERITVPHGEPSKWDGPEDDEFYRVSFLSASTQLETRIRVDFAPGVSWDRRIQIIGRGFNDIEPPWRWFAKGTAPRVLAPFDIIRKPLALADD